MISYLKGEIKEKGKDFIVLENKGIGFRIFVSEKNLKKIELNEQKEIFVFFIIRNEKPELYGFLSKEELEVFEIVEAISGIGVKGALLVSSLGPIEELKRAVSENDAQYFSKIKGIGKKKVQKIILELGGSFKEEAIPTSDEALKALVNLGFSKKEAEEALKSVSPELKETKERVQMALRFFNN